MEEKVFKTNFGGTPLEVKINNLAEQANGSVVVKLGDTVVLVTAVMGKKDRPELDFFPLTVDYEEKYYAAGKIYGSRFIRRESRPTEFAILNARMIDRAIRPLFNHLMRREVQVVATVLSIDQENDPDVPALLGASLALGISDIPFGGPISGARMIKNKAGEILINPKFEHYLEAPLNVIFAGQGETINMIEAGCQEITEEELAQAFQMAQKEIKRLNDFQNQVISQAGRGKLEVKLIEYSPELKKEVKDFIKNDLEKSVFNPEKIAHRSPINILLGELLSYLKEKDYAGADLNTAVLIFEDEIDDLFHQKILKEEKRVDGRKLDEVRSITSQVGILPRPHGSGLFMRGLTHALSVVTLASPGEEQMIQGIEFAGTKRFMHHYNFPPYSTGETGFFRGPGRREIGHGALVERALEPIIPSQEDFPYTLRVVSEIISSNGSSSMASCCAASLALMDAGVPIKNPVAGISIGLALGEKGDFKLLTDIQGPEDHHGDMDFKVAGTKNGVTAMQMDVKIAGINFEVFQAALAAAKKARLAILAKMAEVIAGPRKGLSVFAPKIISLQIDQAKIGAVIGPGGRVINDIIARTGAKIDIQESGLVFASADSQKAAQEAIDIISGIVREFKVGEIVKAKVVKIFDYGALVRLSENQTALLHISELADKHVAEVEDVVRLGQKIDVKIKSIDRSGKISVSLKEVKNSRK